MRVVQAGDGYLRRRANLSAGIAALSGCLAVISAIFLWAQPIILLAVLSALLLLGVTSWRRGASWRKGARGEQSVADVLQGLPDSYVLVHDVRLPAMSGNVDHVLVGPCGVSVIEAKHWRGRIFGYGDRWWVNTCPRRSASKQARSAAVEIREYLAAKHPELTDSALRYVPAVVVFTNPLCRLEVKRAPAGVTIIRASQLMDLIRELARGTRLDPPAVSRLAGTLSSNGAPRATLLPDR